MRRADARRLLSILLHRMKHRHFWIILIITTIVWFVVTMSEHSDYPIDVRVEWSGIDTSRFIVTQADTVLPVVVNSNCFNAIDRYLALRDKRFVIQVTGDTVVKVGKALFDEISRQFGFSGTHGVSSSLEELRLSTKERRSRAYVPQLRDVDFVFADQMGLSGDPTIEPDTIWLYGDSTSLCRIPEIYTAPAAVANISDSGYYMLALEPVWKKYRDVRASADSVRIFVPACHYVETTLSVPVEFKSDAANRQVRLYPDHVNVSLWVSVEEYQHLSENQFEAVVNYDPSSSLTELPVYITRFPSQSRIKSVTPATISYVIIQ